MKTLLQKSANQNREHRKIDQTEVGTGWWVIPTVTLWSEFQCFDHEWTDWPIRDRLSSNQPIGDEKMKTSVKNSFVMHQLSTSLLMTKNKIKINHLTWYHLLMKNSLRNIFVKQRLTLIINYSSEIFCIFVECWFIIKIMKMFN